MTADELSVFLPGVGIGVALVFLAGVVRDLVEDAISDRATAAFRAMRCAAWSPAPGEDDLPVQCDRPAGHVGAHTRAYMTWEDER